MKWLGLALGLLLCKAASAQELQPFPDAQVYLPLSGGTLAGSLTLSSGVFTAPGGSSALPSFTFTGSTGTGISTGGVTNNLVLSTAGSGRFYLDANGHMLAISDNAYDIGAAAATRPRTLYLGTSANIAATALLNVSGGALRVRNNGDSDHLALQAGPLNLIGGGTDFFIVASTGDISLVAATDQCWSSTSNATGGKDTCLYRVSAGRIGVSVTAGAGTPLGQLAEMLLSTTTSIDWNVSTKTTLFTVPSGKSAVITRVVWRAATASATTASCGVGYNAAPSNDVIAAATHTALTGSTLYSVDSAKAGALVGTAGAVLGVSCPTPQGGALTTTADVYGYLF